jgi:hypothetical protein
MVERLGRTPLWEIGVERSRGSHSIWASVDQVWPINSPARRLNSRQPLPFHTQALTEVVGSPTWKLVTVNPTEVVSLDRDGILHGIVFGDGAYHRQSENSGRKPFCQIYLCNDPAGCDSRNLAPLFQQRGFRPVIRDDKQQVRFYGLPDHWKTLPSAAESPAYLRGFVAGWFAADGHIDHRAPVAMLSSAQRAPLEWLQGIAPRAGLAVSTNICLRRSMSTFGPSEWHCLGLAASTLDADFFVLPEKRRRFRPAQFMKQWKVVYVRPTYVVEPVYSLSISENAYFAIEGNILVCGGMVLGSGNQATHMAGYARAR